MDICLLVLLFGTVRLLNRHFCSLYVKFEAEKTKTREKRPLILPVSQRAVIVSVRPAASLVLEDLAKTTTIKKKKKKKHKVSPCATTQSNFGFPCIISSGRWLHGEKVQSVLVLLWKVRPCGPKGPKWERMRVTAWRGRSRACRRSALRRPP